MIPSFHLSLVNSYQAHKQHLLPASQHHDLLQVTRDIVALHATSPTSPYLSLWARVAGFEREMLDDALYERRTLAKVLSMRVTVHAVPSDEVHLFMRSCESLIESRTPPRFRGARILARAGLCPDSEQEVCLQGLHERVLQVLRESGPATAREISESVPELRTKIRHDIGKPYEGEISVGSRLLNDMTAQGLIIRTRPRGTWRSNLYEYAAFHDWLPAIDLKSVSVQEARRGIVRRYLAAFGPASIDDVVWWTGFPKTVAQRALEPLWPLLSEVAIEGQSERLLMFTSDAQDLNRFSPPDVPYVFLLPSLDPYIMGFRQRRRFLAHEHYKKVFDRAGNALPTVWVNGRVVGAWDQRESDGSVVFGLFEPVSEREQALLLEKARGLGAFLGDTFIKPAFFHTPFTRALAQNRGGTD
ncbi:MAG TPA: winged helix DNA-binding domain-containing protein [Anaerolineae bacterium]|nr:winged helix DNA-binding domain-containing protein [Anaerolineae bacterium]